MLLTLSKCIPSGKLFGIRDTVGEFSRESVSRYVCHACKVPEVFKIMLTRSRRLENNVGRRDFLTSVVDKVKSGEVSHEEMAAHSSTFV